MFEANNCRYLSATEDNNVQRMLGTRSVEEFAAHMTCDAATPEQLDTLAIQFDYCAGRCRASGLDKAGSSWRKARNQARKLAQEARDRLARFPSRETHPGFYNNRPAARPGLLDSDLILPLVMKLHLDHETLGHALYEPPLENNEIYSVGPSKLGYTWLTSASDKYAIKIKTSILRGLIARGHVEAVPLSAAQQAAA